MLAIKTLEAIATAMEADGGALFRQLQKAEFLKLTDAFSGKTESFRTHLGASVIGRSCARDIWYSWHWVKKPMHSARLLRLFNRGHLEEARFLALLRMIGCNVWSLDEHGNQIRITGCGGHFGGSLDGVVAGIPDMPETPMLAEFKTHGTKSFASLKAEGVKKAKWEHYVQMCIYMHAQGLPAALYLAVSKDTDELHGEIVLADQTTAERYLQRAQDVINSPEPPVRINNNPSWYECKFCSHSKMCHQFEEPERNCRTCAHSTALAENGFWYCERKDFHIAKDCQACNKYMCNPSILNNIEVVEANAVENWMVYRRADGVVVDTRIA